LESSKKAIERAIQDLTQFISNSCTNIQTLCKNFNLVDELHITVRQLETEARLLTSSVARQQSDDFIKSIRNLMDALGKQQAMEHQRLKEEKEKKKRGFFRKKYSVLQKKNE